MAASPPVLLVFSRFEGTLSFGDGGTARGLETGFNISSLSAGGHHKGGDGKGNSALGGLALRGVLFVRNDVLLMGSTPLGLENAIHFA